MQQTEQLIKLQTDVRAAFDAVQAAEAAFERAPSTSALAAKDKAQREHLIARALLRIEEAANEKRIQAQHDAAVQEVLGRQFDWEGAADRWADAVLVLRQNLDALYTEYQTMISGAQSSNQALERLEAESGLSAPRVPWPSRDQFLLHCRHSLQAKLKASGRTNISFTDAGQLSTDTISLYR